METCEQLERRPEGVKEQVWSGTDMSTTQVEAGRSKAGPEEVAATPEDIRLRC